jgi:arginine-tRNA-protein transferase
VVEKLILPKTADFSSGGKVSVVAARAHPPSGQIIITLQILEAPSMPADYLDVSMRDESDDLDDKLGAWYYEATQNAVLPSQRELTVRTLTAYESALDPEAFRLYARYQHVVHNDPDPFSKDSHSPKEKGNDGDEEENIVISELDWGNAPKYFLDRIDSTLNALIQGQDQELHNSILSTFYSYYQFLVEAPFPFGDGSVPLQAPACGNYHQHYRIGESLIAVGVVDILPNGFSSVYLYYDPAFSHRLVALGKFATLKEIEYTHRELQKPYYYLGYYITLKLNRQTLNSLSIYRYC